MHERRINYAAPGPSCLALPQPKEIRLKRLANTASENITRPLNRGASKANSYPYYNFFCRQVGSVYYGFTTTGRISKSRNVTNGLDCKTIYANCYDRLESESTDSPGSMIVYYATHRVLRNDHFWMYLMFQVYLLQSVAVPIRYVNGSN